MMMNTSMENEISPEVMEEEFDSICGTVKSLQERVMVFYQKRCSSLKESLDKHLESFIMGRIWSD